MTFESATLQAEIEIAAGGWSRDRRWLALVVVASLSVAVGLFVLPSVFGAVSAQRSVPGVLIEGDQLPIQIVRPDPSSPLRPLGDPYAVEAPDSSWSFGFLIAAFGESEVEIASN